MGEHVAETQYANGLGYWEAIFELGALTEIVEIRFAERGRVESQRHRLGEGGVKGAWRRLCVLADIGDVECTAHVGSPLTPRTRVDGNTLIFFNIAETPAEANIGQIVLEGPNGEHLYNPRFLDRRATAASQKKIITDELIGSYQDAEGPIDFGDCNPRNLATTIHRWGQDNHPEEWQGQLESVRRRLYDLKKYSC